MLASSLTGACCRLPLSLSLDSVTQLSGVFEPDTVSNADNMVISDISESQSTNPFASPIKSVGKLVFNPSSSQDAIVAPLSESSATAVNAMRPRLEDWTEHILPDASYYYTLPAHRAPGRIQIVTDIDLRAQKRLFTVSAYIATLAKHNVGNGSDTELYLRNTTAGLPQADFAPLTALIDHATRSLGGSQAAFVSEVERASIAKLVSELTPRRLRA